MNNTNTINVTRGVCRLHLCGNDATHLVMHQLWGLGNVMECCQEKARQLSDARVGHQLYAWDSLTSPAPIPEWVANYIAKGGQL
jgi:hypothetical protein